MNAMSVAALMTADEFLELPAARWPWTQLVAGEVVAYEPLP
jgi:hypothetical protein